MSSAIERIAGGKVLARMRSILLHGDMDFSELMTAGIAFFWGAALLLTPITLYQPGRATLVMMRDIAPEVVWGIIAVLIGACQAFGIFYMRPQLSAASSVAAFLFWAFVAWLFVVVNPSSPHWIVYAGIAMAAGWSYLRSAIPLSQRLTQNGFSSAAGPEEEA